MVTRWTWRTVTRRSPNGHYLVLNVYYFKVVLYSAYAMYTPFVGATSPCAYRHCQL